MAVPRTITPITLDHHRPLRRRPPRLPPMRSQWQLLPSTVHTIPLIFFQRVSTPTTVANNNSDSLLRHSVRRRATPDRRSWAVHLRSHPFSCQTCQISRPHPHYLPWSPMVVVLVRLSLMVSTTLWLLNMPPSRQVTMLKTEEDIFSNPIEADHLHLLISLLSAQEEVVKRVQSTALNNVIQKNLTNRVEVV